MAEKMKKKDIDKQKRKKGKEEERKHGKKGGLCRGSVAKKNGKRK